MKKYKFITIQQRNKEMFSKHPVYSIINNAASNQIGLLSWYSPWKQYVFSSRPECVFNTSCLKDVIDFIENHAGKEGEDGK